MTNKQIAGQLLPGVVAGMLLGLGVNYAVGVNAEVMPNIISGAMAAIAPTILNSLVVLKTSRKLIDQRPSKGKVAGLVACLAVLAGLIGFAVAALMQFVLNIDLTALARMNFAVLYAVVGVTIQTAMGVVLLKKLSARR